MLICNKERYLIRKIESQYLLLDMESGEGHLLDDIASIMFQEITTHDVDEAILNMMKYFDDVDVLELTKDVKNFVVDLISKGVFCRNDS